MKEMWRNIKKKRRKLKEYVDLDMGRGTEKIPRGGGKRHADADADRIPEMAPST